VVVGDFVGFNCLRDATGCSYPDASGAAGGFDCVADEYERGNGNTAVANANADGPTLGDGRAFTNGYAYPYPNHHANT
jgi:hypothetical protein